jgi:hypothetical protein
LGKRIGRKDGKRKGGGTEDRTEEERKRIEEEYKSIV